MKISLLRKISALAGSVGVLGCLWCFWVNPSLFLRSYLWAYLFWMGISLGGLSFAMIFPLVEGRWPSFLGPYMEMSYKVLLPLSVLFLPILLGLEHIFPWTQGVFPPKSRYLNPAMFTLRAVAYFLFWLSLSWALQRGKTHLCGPGLLLLAFANTFAAVDWMMSLNLHWSSSMFPVIVVASQLLLALAVNMGAAWLIAPRKFSDSSRDLGNMLLALVMIWAYLSFSQFLIMWMGNKPEEVSWYGERLQGAWKATLIGLMLFKFALPFVLLLFRKVKDNGKNLFYLSCLIAATQMLEISWNVLRAFHLEDYGSFLFMGFLSFFGLGAVFIWSYLGELLRKSGEIYS